MKILDEKKENTVNLKKIIIQENVKIGKILFEKGDEIYVEHDGVPYSQSFQYERDLKLINNILEKAKIKNIPAIAGKPPMISIETQDGGLVSIDTLPFNNKTLIRIVNNSKDAEDIKKYLENTGMSFSNIQDILKNN
jgi:hypothetical protein